MTQIRSIFLSHSHKDKPFVRQLAGDLRRRGARVWVDEAEILIGDSLIAKIGDAIETMDFVGAVLSEQSIRSSWVTRELEIALNHEIAGRQVKVLPLVIDGCVIPPFLQGKVYADFRDKARYDETVEQLMRRLSKGDTPANVPDSKTTKEEPAAITDAGASPFEIKLLVAVNNLRPLAADFAAANNAEKFLNGVANLGTLIRTSPSSLLAYKCANEFLSAYNDLAELAGKELTKPADEIRDIVVTLLKALDTLTIEVGIQALRTAYPGDRERAARILGQLGPTAEAAVGPLRRALKDSSGPVRMAVAWALTAIGTDEAIRAVESYERG